MAALKIVVREELAHGSHLVLAPKEADHRRVLRLSSCQLVEDFDNAVGMMDGSLLSTTDLKPGYMITGIHDDEGEDRVCFDISGWTVTYIDYKMPARWVA